MNATIRIAVLAACLASAAAPGGGVAIPKGCFSMGSDDGEPGGRPAHKVCLDAFRMDRTEATNAQFRARMGANPHEDDGTCFVWESGGWRMDRLPAGFRGPDQPAVCVDHDQAREYCTRAGGRLPTEAEWEYAAKAGTTGRWYWGESAPQAGKYAWFRANSGASTHPVGTRLPNAWGLRDMLGNAWEWVEDWYDEGYYAASPVANPEGPESGAYKTYRGGGWFSTLSDHGLGSTVRGGLNPASARSGLGFRCVVPQ